MYPVQKYLNPYTGGDVVRGLLEFGLAKQITTEDQVDDLRIHGADVFGKDKLKYSERIKWINSHVDLIKETVRDPFEL